MSIGDASDDGEAAAGEMANACVTAVASVYDAVVVASASEDVDAMV